MSVSRLLIAAAIAALLSTPALAETPAEAATHMPPPADTGMGMGGHGGGMRHFLSDNERMMFMVDMHKAVAGMTDDQKQAYRQQQATAEFQHALHPYQRHELQIVEHCLMRNLKQLRGAVDHEKQRGNDA